jgi:hypothetical protein
MTTYTHKYVNGVLTALNAADHTALTTRDGQDWSNGPAPATAAATAAEKIERMIKTFGLTLAEFKAEIARP